MAVSAATHLATYGVSVQQARDFIFANVNDPGTIYAVARQFGVTNAMLAEIVGEGFTAQQVSSFFVERGFDGPALGGLDTALPDGSSGGTGSTSGGSTSGGLLDDNGLFPDALETIFASLVGLNNRTGPLSNAELRAAVLSNGVTQSQYDAFFAASVLDDNRNGTIDAAEIGLSSGVSFTATPANIESLVYGTMLNLFERIDLQETLDLANFAQINAVGLQTGNTATLQQYINLLVGVFEDVANPPLLQAAELRASIVPAIAIAVKTSAGQSDSISDLFGGFIGL